MVMYSNFTLAKSAREYDVDGRLRVSQSNISKETVNPYYGYEIPNYQGLGLDGQKIYHLYRPGEELAKAASSFNAVQIVSKHTPMFGDQPNKEIVIGATGTDAVFEAPYLKNSLAFWDSEAIGLIDAADHGYEGAKELSCGYAFEALMEPGTFDGQDYDGKMINIIGNHLALVDRGRAGSDVKVADRKVINDEDIMKKDGIKKEASKKIKAMDIDIPAEQIDALIDTVLGVSDQGYEIGMVNGCMTDPEPEIISEDSGIQSGMETAMKMLQDKGLTGDEINSLCTTIRNQKMADKSKAPAAPAIALDAENDKDDEMDMKAADEKDEDEKDDEKEDMKKAMDVLRTELRTIENRLTQKFKNLDQAKHDVRDMVGDVMSIDSAEEVYRFALDQMSIDHKEIKELSALKALCKLANQRNSTIPNAGQAHDSAPSMLMDIPNLARIRI